MCNTTFGSDKFYYDCAMNVPETNTNIHFYWRTVVGSESAANSVTHFLHRELRKLPPATVIIFGGDIFINSALLPTTSHEAQSALHAANNVAVAVKQARHSIVAGGGLAPLILMEPLGDVQGNEDMRTERTYLEREAKKSTGKEWKPNGHDHHAARIANWNTRWFQALSSAGVFDLPNVTILNTGAMLRAVVALNEWQLLHNHKGMASVRGDWMEDWIHHSKHVSRSVVDVLLAHMCPEGDKWDDTVHGVSHCQNATDTATLS
jgi:hypothetical protein